MKKMLPALPALAVAVCATSAVAGSSEWHHAEGGSVRIVTAGEPDGEGRLRGALEIRLKPGWKTYWADPGDSGVPPIVDVAGAGQVEIGFPAPLRFDDGYAVWAGYDRPVALTLTIAGLRQGASLEAQAFLGMCETICIPVQAGFSIDSPRQAGDGDETAVANAFDALPEPARPGFAAKVRAVRGTEIEVYVDVPAGAAVNDLFVASGEAMMVGAVERRNDTTFLLPILAGQTARPTSLHYTLVTSSGAVSGTLAIH